jgi:hypothetical protein
MHPLLSKYRQLLRGLPPLPFKYVQVLQEEVSLLLLLHLQKIWSPVKTLKLIR